MKSYILYLFVNSNCVFIFTLTWDRIFKKRWLKHQDWNLESFYYESGILPLHPNLIEKYKFIYILIYI